MGYNAAMDTCPGKKELVFDPRTFGAVGDGKTKDTRAIQGSIDACARAGGGVVYLSPGRYLTAPINLASYVTFYLEAGA